jgi:hypothetical protein
MMRFQEREAYGVRLFRANARVAGPSKLFVGGLHGDEGRYTAPILDLLAQEDLSAGEAIIVPSLVENGSYIGVLNEKYYKSDAGKILLQLIQDCKPRFYFELHAYGKHAYERLTDPERVKKIGVPHFIELVEGILIGSIAPILRRKFTLHNFCMTLEVPKWKSDRASIKEEVLEILQIALKHTNREALMHEYRMRYPMQVKMAEELFYTYYRHQLKPF